MDIKALYKSNYGREPMESRLLPGAGSNRRYYRLTNPDGSSVIGTEGDDYAENRAFCMIGAALSRKRLPVPGIIATAPDFSCYIQEDLGDVSLFDEISNGRETGVFSDKEKALLKKAVEMLARIQGAGRDGFDFSVCAPYKEMDARMVSWDLNYFKYCFLKPAIGEVDDGRLQDDFDRLAARLLKDRGEWDTFMVRDFQSRNIMVTRDGLRLIDFQGGRRGPRAYDLVSLLWQAKANIPQRLRDELADAYIREANRLGGAIGPERFRREISVFALFRILQTLGAYGFRGLIQGKQHFIESITRGVRNLRDILSQLSNDYPYLYSLADSLCRRFTPYEEEPGLTVTVGSFSYRKGYPTDPSGNGGGFVFDCRALHNPGRYDQYRQPTGRDAEVRRFLEDDGEVFDFLAQAEAMVGASVRRYVKRGFTSLSVWFGCTGGRHRSVYCAEAMARHLNERYGVRIRLAHREQGIDEVLSPKNV